MDKRHLTTFQAAKLLSVSPDAILKWIKSGKLSAFKTPGGHHRIESRDIEELLHRRPDAPSQESICPKRCFQYCWEFWEFNAFPDSLTNKCEDCVVYKARAKRCYQMSDIPSELGHLRLFCRSSCDECKYYVHVKEADQK